MRQIKFETDKGEFLLIDLPSYEEIEKELGIFGHDQGLTNDDLNSYFRHILPDFNKSYELSEITEEQASEIVDETIMWNKHKVKCYRYRSYIEGFVAFDNAIESLHSLLESKGIHLYENPYKNHQDKDLDTWYEELTFYNPFIFKLDDKPRN